jgi:hypothetical protein
MQVSNNNFHLTYCTNIHPGETWEQVRQNLEQYIPPLKAKLSPQAPFGIGLRLSDAAARELLAADNLVSFQNWLKESNTYVFTLNGFPYGGFHRQVVKDRVYAPDWTERSRLDYTHRLLDVLAALLPQGIDGSISTLPLSYKPWQTDDKACDRVFEKSSLHLAMATEQMLRIENETGKFLHLALEPEPDCLLENTEEAIAFFENWLLPVGGAYLAQQQGISRPQAEEKLRDRIRLCYDTCHFAVEYEEPASVFERLQAAGLKIGKIQLSAAIKAGLASENRTQLNEYLHPFAESTYLHQVIERKSDGTLQHYNDLAIALPQLATTPALEWRIHFHVPIFIRDYQFLQSTQDDLVTVLNFLQNNPICNHLEIETYTWDVLPDGMKLDILGSIQREYEWVCETLQHDLVYNQKIKTT